jgi:molybdopterin converting factor small subunit
VAKIEERELEGHRAEIIADVEKLVAKYRKIFDWDVPDIDQAAADKLILAEVRKALEELEHKLLG